MRETAVSNVSPMPTQRTLTITEIKRTAIYRELRHSAAMSQGLEALAVRALENGEATEDVLEAIADLSQALTAQITAISTALNEIVEK
jgi:hypothetical protein